MNGYCLTKSRISVIIFKLLIIHADVAELADALDLGSSVPDVQVQVLSSAPKPDTDFDISYIRIGVFVSLFK